MLLVAGALLAPAAAIAQQNPFQGLPPAGQEQQTQPVTPTTDEEDDGLKRWQQLLIFGGGVLLIAGIGFGIMHDARKRAPVDDERRYFSHRSSEDPQHKRKADRKKTRAQKQARKRQRAKR